MTAPAECTEGTRGDRSLWIAWTVAALAALLLLEAERAPSTFFYDDWGFVQFRRGWSFDWWWAPHAGHLVAVPTLLYRVMFEIFGLTGYRAYRLLGLLVHLFVCTMVVHRVRRRSSSMVAWSCGVALALLGSGWQNILFPFSIAHMLPVGMGLVAWNLLERPSRRRDAMAAAALLVAVSSSGLGVAMAAGAAAVLLVHRHWARTVAVVGPSAVVYLVWYLLHDATRGGSQNLARIPRFAVDMVAGGAGGLFGRDLLWGRLLLGVIVGVLLLRRHRLVAAAAPIGMIVANAVLAGWARADVETPTASRYTYTAAAMLLVVLADTGTLEDRQRLRAAVVLPVLVLSVWGNWAVLHRGALGLRIDSSIGGAELRAVEWARNTVDPMFEPDPRRMPFLYAGSYLAAVDDLGSPAWSDAQILASDDENILSLVDRVSVHALRIVDAAVVEPADVGEVCGDPLVTVEAGDVIRVWTVDEPAEIRLRRFSSTVALEPDLVLEPGESVVLDIPADGAPRSTWTVEVSSAGQSCTSR